ncbi:MAG TPA: hypothetical protein PLQ93_10445 [Bacteroidia bacterium]|nr:hypothetical protein [Bacteroidia bacterium]
MKILHLIAILMLACLLSLKAQVRVVKPVKKPKLLETRLGLGAGLAGSVLYLERNVKENNNARGFHFSAVYGISSLFRSSLEYTYYKTIDIAPTWYNIKASTIEWNLHIMARFSEGKAYFYPIIGLSYNSFSGYFTGVNDFLNLKAVYPINQDVSSKWLGLNVGTGYEYYFKHLSFFMDYKMRVGRSDSYKNLNIMDVCLSAGLRLNLRVPTLYALYRGPRSRYLLRVKPND